MANALASTIFAQRMGLREKLLQQAREDKMVEDDRKVKLIAETNRSTDLALQAQSKAMERKRRDAAELAQMAAYLGKETPRIDEPGAVMDALQIGSATGEHGRVVDTEKQALAQFLEELEQRGANSRNAATVAETARGNTLRDEDRDRQAVMDFNKWQAEKQRADTMLPYDIEHIVADTGEHRRSPAQMALRSYTEIDKQYRDTINTIRAERPGLLNELNSYNKGNISPILNAKKIKDVKLRLEINLQAERDALNARLQLAPGNLDLAKALQQVNAQLGNLTGRAPQGNAPAQRAPTAPPVPRAPSAPVNPNDITTDDLDGALEEE